MGNEIVAEYAPSPPVLQEVGVAPAYPKVVPRKWWPATLLGCFI
jgi:hypothetical protein